MFLDALFDAVIDSLKLLPFLFVTYLLMEYLEHKAGNAMQVAIHKSGMLGPVWGSILGILPQCGFSASVTSLYAGRVVTLGTLLAVYLSTSDEMIPIMISSKIPLLSIVKIIAVKVVIGMTFGFLVDFAARIMHKAVDEPHIDVLCEQDNCHCEEGILKSSIHHTVEIFLYVFVISYVLNLVIAGVGLEFLQGTMFSNPIVGILIAGLIGLIPNCAASVAIIQLYLNGVIGTGPMIAGLLVGAGVGLLILFRMNRNAMENIKIVGMLYVMGVVGGLLVHFCGFQLI